MTHNVLISELVGGFFPPVSSLKLSWRELHIYRTDTNYSFNLLYQGRSLIKKTTFYYKENVLYCILAFGKAIVLGQLWGKL